MRYICEVIDRIMVHIPETETALRSGLERVKRDAPYIPPEAAGHSWRQGQYLLSPFWRAPKPEWADTVGRIWSGQE